MLKAILVLCSILVLPGCVNGCGYGYSDGERAGVVVKLSHKGAVYKSWEGQLNIGGVVANGEGSMVPNVWEFSVRKDDAAKAIQEALSSGRRVTLHYKQWLISPIDIDTDYEIDSVK